MNGIGNANTKRCNRSDYFLQAGNQFRWRKLPQLWSWVKQKQKALVAAVMEEFNQMHSGIQIIQINDSYQMCTKAEFESHIRLALELKK